MALNPSTNATMAGRITTADGNYPYGSSKDETAPAAGDGTPYFKARADDIFGFQQALLALAGIIPSGNAETVNDSEYTKAITELAAGRATVYDEDGTSAANAYVIALRADQQGANSLFDGLTVVFTTAFVNTGASTIDVSEAIGQTVGTTIKNVKLPDGSDPAAGDLDGRSFLTYNLASDRFELLFVAADSGIGVGQTWQNLTGSRSAGVVYTNTTGKPILVNITVNPDTGSDNFTVEGVIVANTTLNPDTDSTRDLLSAIVPDSSTYIITAGANITNWAELR